MLLEQLMQEGSCFVTLTYDEAHVPAEGTLVPEDLRNWIKRLRKVFAPEKVRYYAAGEYGDQSWRPHYHAALFGMSADVAGGVDGCSGLVARTWPYGYTYVGDLTRESAQYVAGYVTKKLNKKDDPRLVGRHPEFSRMSLRPGIGAGAMEAVAGSLMWDRGGLEEVERNVDVPGALCHGGKSLPLGRYLKRRLRGELGFESKDTPVASCKQYASEMSFLFAEALSNPENSSKSLSEIVVDMNKQKIINMENRRKIFDSRRVKI